MEIKVMTPANTSCGPIRAWAPTMIVLHCTESQNGLSWLLHKDCQVSCHFVVQRNGTIIRLRDDNVICWHTGEWANNEKSIAIEIENLGVYNKITNGPMTDKSSQYLLNAYNVGKYSDFYYPESYYDVQYDAIKFLISELHKNYGTMEIKRHSELIPSYRCDPGGHFEMSRVT